MNPDIRGFTVGPTEHKLSAYMDDVLFYVSDPLIVFNFFSNFKNDYNKSEVLPLIMSPGVRTQLQASFSFTWCRTAMKYLKVYLPAHCSQLYTCNYAPLLSTVKADLHGWGRTTFTWMGRVSILKMNVLPRILFYLQMVPISLPRSFFSTLNSLFLK